MLKYARLPFLFAGLLMTLPHVANASINMSPIIAYLLSGESTAPQSPITAPLLEEPTYITNFTYSGDAVWTEDNAVYHTATSSWKNEDIDNSQSACMEVTVDESEDAGIAFAYRVSSEGGYDYLSFYIDNAIQGSFGGNIEWTTAAYPITLGSHTLKWCYRKDDSVSSGDDTAWVDDIKVGDLYDALAEDRSLGTVGNIEIVPQDNAEIESFTIEGKGSEKFEVANDGTLSLAAKLDYETQRVYTLHFTAHNSTGSSNTVTKTITVTDVDDLYILNAFYDDNHTAEDTTDDRLLLQYSKSVDEGSIDSPVGTNFVINLNETVDDGESTAVYNASQTYYPHMLSLLRANTLLEQNISIAPDTLTSGGTETQDSTKTLIRPTTGSSVVKKTGQTKSYDVNGVEPYFQTPVKDDGYYQSGVAPRYSRDDVKEVVLDHITGLMWADDTSVSSVTKQWLTDENYGDCQKHGNNCENTDSNPSDPNDDTATEYCAAMSLGGYDDWRLPTSVELEGIVDHGRVNPSIDTVYFNHTSSNYYWSSTTYDGNKYNAWVVGFYSGGTDYNRKSYSTFVRCVRVGQ